MPVKKQDNPINVLVSDKHLDKLSDEMVLIFQSIIAAIDKLKTELSQNVALTNVDLTERMQIVLRRAEDLVEAVGNRLSAHQSKVAVDINLLTKQLHKEIKALETSIPTPPDLAPLEDKINAVEAKIPQLPPELTSEQVVSKVNDDTASLIKRERIEGLDEELEKLSKVSRGVRMGTRRVFQPRRDDFTASTDGSTKTFYLTHEPLDESSVMVYGTDFPVILRPTIDFTLAGKLLTLTSAVPAPTQGATLICTYFA